MSVTLQTKNGGSGTSTLLGGSLNGALADGVLYGCACTMVNGAISIGAGAIIMAGRWVTFTGEALTPTTGSEVIVHINTAEGTAQLIARAAAALIQEDIYASGDEYEVQLCTYTTNGSTVTAVTRTLPAAKPGNRIFVQSAQPTSPQTGDLWFW